MPSQTKDKAFAATIAAAVWVAAMAAFLMFGCFGQKPNQKTSSNQAVSKPLDELDRKLKDPRVSNCFQSAFALGKAYRQQGRIKPSQEELHLLGLGACDHYKVPPEMRGVAVDKFKSGFGWGWSSGP